MRVIVDGLEALRFDDGTPVRAASGIAPFGDGWLIAQDDATAAAWRRPGSVTAVRMLPPVEGHDLFAEGAGTKHLKPDLEAACPIDVEGDPAVMLLGSGSSPRRMRGALVRLVHGRPVAFSAELGPLYRRIAERLGLPADGLNLEGAARHGATVRWFNRGNLTAGLPSASVDIPVADLVDAILGERDAGSVPVEGPRVYDLGEAEGISLAVTDAIGLPDGRALLSAAAEDTPNAIDDGPVVATALALVDDTDVLAVAAIPEVAGRVHKVEGLALQDVVGDTVHLIAVVDADDPGSPSAELRLRAVLG